MSHSGSDQPSRTATFKPSGSRSKSSGTREQGTKATLMKDTPNFEERSKVYALGELWLSYANGEDEAPLLQGGPRP